MVVALQGWFRQGFFLWPLWCPTDPPCPLHCLATGRFAPFIALRLMLFYVSAGVIFILRKKGKWPDHTGFDASFDRTFYIAWHIPMIVIALPLGGMAMIAGRDVWRSGDRFLEYGYISDPLVSEVGTWFVSILLVDCFLIVLHRLGNKELYLHHLIFGIGGVLWVRHCCGSLTVCILVTQELSNLPLNMFTLCRAYQGLHSVWTKTWFLAFAVTFYIFRVFLNTFGTVHFLCEVIHGHWGASALRIPRYERPLLGAILVSAWVLQIFWARRIAIKILLAARGTLSPETSLYDDEDDQGDGAAAAAAAG